MHISVDITDNIIISWFIIKLIELSNAAVFYVRKKVALKF